VDSTIGCTYPTSTDPDTTLQAAIRQDGYLGGGRKPAELVQKVYLQYGQIPANISADWQEMSLRE
jgi:hypothetical protein